MSIPQDPVILLSFINTYLRDHYKNLGDLCKSLNIDETSLKEKLKIIQYEYDPAKNQFI
jgi:transcriptional regulator with PAS, ATPase and Fis domain